MVKMVKKFDVKAAHITQRKQHFFAIDKTAFDKGNKITGEHEQQILERRTMVGNWF